MSLHHAWERVKARVARRIGANDYEVWIVPLRLSGSGEDWVELGGGNEYFYAWVQANYLRPLVEEWSAELGKPVAIRFRLDEEPTPTHPAAPGTPSPNVGLARPDSRSTLPPDKTFETFVVGPCNSFAHAAALAVAENPGKAYNPLYIFGGTGLGKTHLVQAIGNRLLERAPHTRVFYLSCEEFLSEMVRALRKHQMPDFQERYRENVDVLIMDDIQFLSRKEGTQDEFFHTFETLKASGKQIIVTSDVMPRDIVSLEPRLRTRFEGGMVADVQVPDIETMAAIAHRKAHEFGMMDLGDEVALWLASRIRSSVRELEGALRRLAALTRLKNTPLTIEMARQNLHGLLPEEVVALTPDKVMQAVARFYNVKVSDLKGERKLKGIVQPRQIAMYLARHHTGLSFPDLGRAFGGRDHSTIQHACKKIREELARDPDLRAHIEAIQRNLGVSPGG